MNTSEVEQTATQEFVGIEPCARCGCSEYHVLPGKAPCFAPDCECRGYRTSEQENILAEARIFVGSDASKESPDATDLIWRLLEAFK